MAQSIFSFEFEDEETCVNAGVTPLTLQPTLRPVGELETLPVVTPPDNISFAKYTQSLNPLPGWPSMLTTELALGLDSEDYILEKYMVSRSDYEYLRTLPVFRKELANKISERERDGWTYRIKARAQAEAYLAELHDIVTADSTPASTRLDAIKYITKVADLEPKESKNEGQQGQMFNIQINF